MAATPKYKVSDIQVIKAYQQTKNQKLSQKALYTMWDRYTNLRYKMKNQLIRCCIDNKMALQESIEEYDSRAWEKFLNAMNSIRPNDCAHIENWKFYIQLWGYWRSLNRDIIHEYLSVAKKNISISTFSDEDNTEMKVSNIDIDIAKKGTNTTEYLFNEKIKKQIFLDGLNRMKSKLTPKQKILVGFRQKGVSKTKICQTLKINSDTFENNLLMIKRLLQESLQESSKKYSYEVNYEDFLN